MVFHEEEYGGAGWNTNLTAFRRLHRGEANDAISQLYWSVFTISSVMFVTSLAIHHASLINAVVLIPLILWMFWQTRAFHRKHNDILTVWRQVKSDPGRLGAKSGSERETVVLLSDSNEKSVAVGDARAGA
jgi:hypothetical protein